MQLLHLKCVVLLCFTAANSCLAFRPRRTGASPYTGTDTSAYVDVPGLVSSGDKQKALPCSSMDGVVRAALIANPQATFALRDSGNSSVKPTFFTVKNADAVVASEEVQVGGCCCKMFACALHAQYSTCNRISKTPAACLLVACAVRVHVGIQRLVCHVELKTLLRQKGH